MAATKAGPAVPGWLAAGIIGIALGAAGGYYAGADKPEALRAAAASAAGPGSPAGPGGPAGMPPPPGMGGGGGGSGASEHPNAVALMRTVGALVTLEKARGQELTAEQRRQVAQVAAELQQSDEMTEEQCEAKLTALTGGLSAEQKTTLEELTARPGGGRGGGGGSGRGGSPAPGGAPGGLPMPVPISAGGGGMSGGGGGPDFERPFKEGRARERLDELVDLLGR
jgi:hypothetical protein